MAESGGSKVAAVTGASGYVAGRLIEVLCASGDFDKILGFDLRIPDIDHDSFSFERVDVRSPDLQAHLRGVDVLVHLAFIMDPISDENEMRDVNVNGSQNVFRCAGRAGVDKIVYPSSTTVYGAHPDNELPLTETSPLRANLDFSYPAHKLEVEYVVREVREEFPDLTITVLRTCIVFGPHTDNAWSHLLEMPVLLGVTGHEPPFQFVHEEDVVKALVHAIDNDLDGGFNLAPEGWISTEDVLAILERRQIYLSEPVMFAAWSSMWAAGIVEAPSGILHYLMYPWVVTGEKLAATGFSAAHTSADALKGLKTRLRDNVRLGHRTVRRSVLTRTAAAGAGLVGAAATVLAVRSRRSA
jgi:nucleoside-diphosphate-sugar epimerase